MGWNRWLVVGAALTVLGAGREGRADLLLAQRLVQQQFTFYQAIDRYSDGGVASGQFAGVETEEISSIASADGTVYTVSNTLGGGMYRAFNSNGDSIAASSPSQVQEPASITVGGNGNVLVGSTQFDSNGVTGIVEVNALTGAFVKTVRPTAPAGSLAEFNNVDKLLYISNSQGTTQYSYNSTLDSYPQNGAFPTLPDGTVRFAPADTDVFLSPTTRTKIDRYDSSGSPLGAFVPAGSGGVGTIEDFAFGNGSLYVLSFSSGTEQLLQYDGSTGAFQASLGSVTGYSQLVYLSTPEPSSALAGGTVILALVVRRRKVRL